MPSFSLCLFALALWPANDPVLETAKARLPRGYRIEQINDPALGPEGYRIDGRAVRANTPRAALWGAYAAAEGRTGTFKPYFPVREWWSAAYQANFNLPLGGAFDRPIEEISGIVRRTIHEAPRYGIHTLQLMGRAGEGGIDASWFLEYGRFPKLRSRRLGYGIERRISEIRALAAEAHRYGLDFLLWDHELVFPPGMLEAYPELRGVGYPYCFSQPILWRFLDGKFDEFFERLPEVDGVTLTFAETRGYNILEHGGCQCDACRRVAPEDKVRRVIAAVDAACRRNGKRLEVRSYNQAPRHAEVMRRALEGLELPIITKVTVVDFRGIHYPDDPLLGAFRRQAMELTACPEGSGYGYIPALLGDFYKQKAERAVRDRMAGFAIRTDYHLQYGHATFFTEGPPVMTFDTANDFNVYAASRLAWDPTLEMDALWREWAARKYSVKVIPALKRSAGIAEGIFFVKGFSLLTHLNQVPHLATIDDELNNSYLLQFFPGKYENVYKQLADPTDATIAQILAEKDRAIAAARQSRTEVKGFADLERGFRTAENAARLWRGIAEVYFRLRQHKPVDAALGALEAEARRIEAEDGKRWPVYPAARGVTIWDFIQEARERSRQ